MFDYNRINLTERELIIGWEYQVAFRLFETDKLVEYNGLTFICTIPAGELGTEELIAEDYWYFSKVTKVDRLVFRKQNGYFISFPCNKDNKKFAIFEKVNHEN